MKLVYGALLISSLTAAGSESWNWEKSVGQVTKANAEVEAARETLRAKEFQERAAYGAFFPKASASLGYTYGTGSGSSQSGLIPELGGGSRTSRYTASLTVTQNLFSGFSDKAKVDQAKAGLEASRASLEGVRARISAELKTVFAGLTYSQKAIRLTEEIIKRRESNLKLIELRFESGRENRGSFLLSRGYLEQAKLDNLQARNSAEASRAQFARVLGLEEAEGLEVAGAVPAAAPPQKVDLSQLTLDTPAYHQAAAEVETAEAAWVTARSGFFPTLNLNGTTTNSEDRFFPGNNRWSVGATLVFPLFSGGSDYYTTKSASQLARAAALAKDNALRQGRVQLRLALSTFQEAVQKLEVDTRFSEAALTRAKIAREKYNNGLLTFEDWDIIENDLILRQKNLLQSERDRVSTQAEWEKAQGKGVIP